MEAIVGLALFSIMMTAVTVMLVSTLRETRKATAISVIKNEGQLAMASMAQLVRFAKSASCVSGNQLNVERQNGDMVTYLLSGGQIASQSSKLTSTRLTVTGCLSGNMFSCPDTRTVDICFTAENASAGGAVTDTAGVNFEARIVLRNFVN